MIGSIDRAVTDLAQIQPLNNSYYAQCLEIFEANSDQRVGLLGWLEANVVAKMSQDANAILSVGCGTGAFDECILRYARARMNQVRKARSRSLPAMVVPEVPGGVRTLPRLLPA